jgi:hypothetical protein
VAHVQWPGGICRDELHHEAPLASRIAAPEGRALLQRAPHHRETRSRREREVDEAGTGDVGLRHLVVARHGGDDRFGRLSGLAPDALGELQRDVGGEVAVRRVLRAIQLDRHVARAGKGVAHGSLDQAGKSRFESGRTRMREANQTVHYTGASSLADR